MKLLKFVPLLVSISLHAAPVAVPIAIITYAPGGKVNVPTTLKSHHVVTITNDSLPDAIFNFKFTLCAPDQPDTCVYKYDTMGLALGQSYTYTIDLAENIRFHVPGSHYVFASTEVTGAAKVSASKDIYIQIN